MHQTQPWPDLLPRALEILAAVTDLQVLPTRKRIPGFVADEGPAVLVVAGHGLRCEHPGGSVPVVPERALLVRPGAAHRYAADSRCTAWQFLPVHRELSCSTATALRGGELRWERGSVLGPGGEEVDHLLRAALATDRRDRAWEAFDLARRAIGDALGAGARYAAGGPNLGARARALLAQRYTDPDCGVRSLATELGCSPDHLGRVFRRRNGPGLRAELVALRLERARHILREERQVSIAEVARRSGFRSASRLCEHFMAAQGVTPSAYRRFGHTQ